MKRATKADAGLLKTSRAVPACSIRPWFITTTRSASAIASSWLWVTWMKLMPSSRLQALQLLAHLHAQEGIERRQRLVEQQHLRVGDQRARQRHALLLAARKLGRQPGGVGLHLRRASACSSARARRVVLVDAAHLQAEGDVVGAVEMREQRVALEHHRRAARWPAAGR